MKSILRRIYTFLKNYGFDAKIFLMAFKRNDDWYIADFEKLIKQKGTDGTFSIGTKYLFLTEKFDHAGVMTGHYFHQDLYVARLIHLANPTKHIDIGSRIDGFIAHVASFREVELFDIREINSTVKNIIFKQADLMELPAELVNYCDSISSLHAIEHFGLGRYNDPIDYWGYLKALKNITKILKNGGYFYFSVPIGPQRIEFNAHRVFAVKYLISILSNDFEIKSFSYVNDKGDFLENVELTESNIESNFNCQYGCGIFTLIKNQSVVND